MKYFILRTQAESMDDYMYLIEHPQEPTYDELKKFLQKHANDKDEDSVWEDVEDIIEINKKKFLLGSLMVKYSTSNPRDKGSSPL